MVIPIQNKDIKNLFALISPQPKSPMTDDLEFLPPYVASVVYTSRPEP